LALTLADQCAARPHIRMCAGGTARRSAIRRFLPFTTVLKFSRTVLSAAVRSRIVWWVWWRSGICFGPLLRTVTSCVAAWCLSSCVATFHVA